MGKVRIVIDSSADFTSPSLVDRHHITVVPGRIYFGAETYLDRQEMDAEAFFKRASRDDGHPMIKPPTVEQYAEVYARLARETDKIVSLHASRHLNSSWQNAKTASETLLGRCDIAVIDSLTTSAGLGMLADIAAKCVERHDSMDDIVKEIRGAITRIYSIFYVDTLDYIRQQSLLGEAQSILGTMLGIKPFLTIEDGHLVTMEKVRTRAQAVDKLVEFVLEFHKVDQLAILQNSPFTTEAVRMLLDRLASETGRRDYPVILYGPTLGCYLGPDATGLAVLENEEEAFEFEEDDE